MPSLLMARLCAYRRMFNDSLVGLLTWKHVYPHVSTCLLSLFRRVLFVYPLSQCCPDHVFSDDLTLHAMKDLVALVKGFEAYQMSTLQFYKMSDGSHVVTLIITANKHNSAIVSIIKHISAKTQVRHLGKNFHSRNFQARATMRSTILIPSILGLAAAAPRAIDKRDNGQTVTDCDTVRNVRHSG